jgi:hypothetical protein
MSSKWRRCQEAGFGGGFRDESTLGNGAQSGGGDWML